MGEQDKCLNVDPWEHTCTRGEWLAGQLVPVPTPEPEELWRCEPCGREFSDAGRMVDHLDHAHGWPRARAIRECGLDGSRMARTVTGARKR